MAMRRCEWANMIFRLQRVTPTCGCSSSLLRPTTTAANVKKHFFGRSNAEKKDVAKLEDVKTSSAAAFPKKTKRLSIFEKAFARFVPQKTIEKVRLLKGTARTYEQLSDEVDVKEFFEQFSMPDTFASWFTIMELHTYVLSARLMKHEDFGMHARDMLVDAFWNDVQFRSRKLGPRASLHRAKQVATLGYQFQAAFYGYDEGVQTNDMVLAAVVWRRFFGFECDDAEQIERVVKYIRVQLDYLTTLSFEDIVFNKKVLTIPLKDVQVG